MNQKAKHNTALAIYAELSSKIKGTARKIPVLRSEMEYAGVSKKTLKELSDMNLLRVELIDVSDSKTNKMVGKHSVVMLPQHNTRHLEDSNAIQKADTGAETGHE